MPVTWDIAYTTQQSSTQSQNGGSGTLPYAFAYSDTYGKYYNGVAGAFNQRLWYSTDAMAWSYYPGLTYGTIYAIYADGPYVMATSSYSIIVTANGSSWSIKYPDPNYRYLFLSGVVGGVFFVGGASSNSDSFTAYYTASNPFDGPWTARTLPASDVWYGSRTIAGRCYIFGRSNVLTSTDAINWVAAAFPALPAGCKWSDVVRFGNTYVATSSTYDNTPKDLHTAVSSDGLTWTLMAPINMSANATGGFASAIAANDFGIMRMASSYYGNTYLEQFSVDGANWYDFVNLSSFRGTNPIIGREGVFQAAPLMAFDSYFTSRRWVAVPTITPDIPPEFWQGFHAATEWP